MSGEFFCFNFSLRGPDSLASKWISEKRKTKGTLKENGANIYAISDYIHEVFCFEKLYGTEHTSNVLFNQIIKLNNFDKDHIVLFEDIILIPFIFSMRSYESGSFKEFTNDFEQEPIYEDKPASKSKLGDLLSATEIKEMLINIYHINYDLRSDGNIKDKKYDEIIKDEYLNFKDKAKLDLFAPYIFEIPTQKVVKSSEEAPVEVLMEETTVQPEIVNTAVEGYFYVKDTGEYAGKNGTSENCYILNDDVAVSKDLENAKYQTSQVQKLSFTHETFRKKAATVYGESTAYKFVKTAKNANNEIYAIAEVFKVNSKAYGAKSEQAKEFLKSSDKENNSWESRKAAYAAIIYTDLNANPSKYSNGATHWDGKEQAIYETDKRGITLDKDVETEGEFTDKVDKSKFELHMNTWGWYIKDEHYKEWKKNIGTDFKAPQKKKATYGMNKDKICALSTVVYNQTIFWKVKNGGYKDDELK